VRKKLSTFATKASGVGSFSLNTASAPSCSTGGG
jgi:hypothetical protein